MQTPAQRPKDDRPVFSFRISPEQQEAVDMAKLRAQRQTHFMPTDKAIGTAGLADFCEKYGVVFPPSPKKEPNRISRKGPR